MPDTAAIITVEPGKLGGKLCIRGLRISVEDVLGYLASGMIEATRSSAGRMTIQQEREHDGNGTSGLSNHL